jgi:hypothetical protein
VSKLWAVVYEATTALRWFSGRGFFHVPESLNCVSASHAGLRRAGGSGAGFFLFPAVFTAIFEPNLHETARHICLNVFRGGMFQCKLCFQLYRPVSPVASFLFLSTYPHAYEAWFLILGEERRLRMFDKVLKIMFRSEKDNVAGDGVNYINTGCSGWHSCVVLKAVLGSNLCSEPINPQLLFSTNDG